MNAVTQQVTSLIESKSTSERAFNEAALAVFEYQYRTIPVVKTLADNAKRWPTSIESWTQIPAVPTPTFKYADLFAHPLADATHIFESSGTSGAPKSRSLFSSEGLKLMELAIRVNAEEMLTQDGRRTRIFVLAPPPHTVPKMIMAWGMERLIHHFGLPGSRFLIGPDGLNPAEVVSELMSAAQENIPITLIGASFGFVHLLDGFKEKGLQIDCAPGSRTMDAGGFKGKSREIAREELDEALEQCLNIAAHRNVNLLGMTELASQFYDNVLRDNTAEKRHKVNAPWTRTQVLNPTTLEVAHPGQSGLLWHLDLANVERPCVIRTHDMGVTTAEGWQVLGRAQNAEARGCSLTVEELLK